MRFVRELRLIPVVLLATTCLLGLKILGLALDGGFTLADLDFSGPPPPSTPPHPHPKTAWAQEMFNFHDVTGSVPSKQTPPGQKPGEQVTENAAPPSVKPAETKPGEEKPAEEKPGETKPGVAKAPPRDPGGRVIQLDQSPGTSPAERAILERLSQRRAELDARARELEIRENLVRSAEQQLDSRAAEVRGMETQANGGAAKKEAEEAARLKGLVTMYENMKPKDAAKIFDRLEMPVLIAVVTKMKPRVMSEILAQMQTEAAERLTVELASRAAGIPTAAPTAQLPKIEGHPR
jgi:flagellar motility protein MotE (MotC chaperone)